MNSRATAEKIIDLYEERIDSITEISRKNNVGGKIRNLSGRLGEDISELAWKEVGSHYAKEYGFRFETVKGDKRKIRCTNNRGNSIDMQVDRHQYINGKLFHVEECKSYLDRCYLIRASDDCRMLKEHTDNNITSSVLAIEDSVKKESYDFIMDEGYIDGVFILADGKRSSTKPIWKDGCKKSLNVNKVLQYVEGINAIFERRIKSVK